MHGNFVADGKAICVRYVIVAPEHRDAIGSDQL
jgi:hypothetical protein